MVRRKDVAFGAAAKNELTISLSLIKQFDPLHPIPAKFQIGWEELMGVPVNLAHYTGLLALAIISDGGYDDLDPQMDALLVKYLSAG